MSSSVWVYPGYIYKYIEWTAKYKALNIYSPAELELGGFAVPAGKLGFSVGVFAYAHAVVFALLQFRRRTVGGDGPKRLQKISFCVLVFLWFMYVLLSSLQAYSLI